MEPQTVFRLSSLAPGAELVLDYLTSRDERWLAVLLAECARYSGRTLADLRERLTEPLSVAAPKHKLRGAAQVLLRLLPEPPGRAPAPREVRARLFRSAAASAASRPQILASVAQELGVDAPTLERALFSDLAGERRIGAVPADLSPSRVALLVNRALVNACLKRAHVVRIRSGDDGRALVRHARYLGLICVATARGAGALELEISGPFALFRKTELYGRALAALLPSAARAPRFELEAQCALPGRALRSTLRLTSDAPIFAESEPTAFDSRVRTRLLRDLARLASPFRLVAEPEPLRVDGQLLFPDFELVHREDERLRFRCELVGFWTPEHLRQRLAQLSAAGEQHYLLCVDEARGCSDAEAPTGARIFRYASRVDAAGLLARLRLEAGL